MSPVGLAMGILFAAGFVLYLHRIFGECAEPSPTSWLVWSLVTSMNAVSFAKVASSPVEMVIPVEDAVVAIMVFAVLLDRGKIHLAQRDTVTLCLACLSFGLSFFFPRSGNALLQLSFALAFLPTIQGARSGGEPPLPWGIWTLALGINLLFVPRHGLAGWFYPAVIFILHLLTFLFAMRPKP